MLHPHPKTLRMENFRRPWKRAQPAVPPAPRSRRTQPHTPSARSSHAAMFLRAVRAHSFKRLRLRLASALSFSFGRIPARRQPARERRMATIDDVLAELAAGQHGVVTRRQLLAAGVTADTVDSSMRRHRLRALHVGVYQAGLVAGPRAREVAAALACNGVVSHRTALAMRQLVAEAPEAPVEITISRDRRVQRPGIRVYRCTLRAGDVEVFDRVSVTTLPRTLFDFAAVATSRELERAFAVAERGSGTLRKRLQQLIDQHPNRRGTRSLRELLRRDAPALTRSEAEELLLASIRSVGIPEPLMNVMVVGYEVDCYWPAARLVAEVDGYAWHGTQRSFHRDRQRDSALAAAGIQVLRLSWQQLSRERDRTMVQLAMAIGRGVALRQPTS